MGSGGLNDTIILTGIIVVLLTMALLMPIIQAEIGGITLFNPTDLNTSVTQSNSTYGGYYAGESDFKPFSTLTLIGSLFNAILWFYDWGTGYLAMLLYAFHFLIRAVAVVIIYRLVRSGAG